MGFKKDIIFLFILIFTNKIAFANSCDGLFPKTPASDIEETLSQKIRSNPQEFPVVFQRYLIKDSRLQHYLKFEGWISGDSHPGQWTFVPNNNEFVYTLADFDMAGRGPLIYDFIQYALNVKAVISQSDSKRNIRIKEMLAAYIDGLQGKEIEPPDWLKEIVNRKRKKFLKIEKNYHKKKISKEKLEIDEGFEKIDENTAKAVNRALRKHSFFDQYEILDYSKKIIDRGGSAGMNRFWVLVKELKSDRKLIYEIKELQEGYLPDWENSVEKMYNFYWQGLTHEAYFPISINGHAYNVRPKKIALDEGDIPYHLNSKSDQIYFEEKALYDLYLIGKAHAAQTPDSSYASSLKNEYDDVAASIKSFIQEYINEMKK
ncbi:MAG: hypothetical protein ACXVCP_01410 [Bdellovibrio sp.]